MVLGGQRHPNPSTPSPGGPSTRIIQTSELGLQHTHAHTSQTHDCTLIHTHTRNSCTPILTHRSVHLHKHVCTNIHEYIHIYTFMYTYAHSHIRTFSHARTDTYALVHTAPACGSVQGARRLLICAQPATAHAEDANRWEPAGRAHRDGAQAPRLMSCTTRPCSQLWGWGRAEPLSTGLDWASTDLQPGLAMEMEGRGWGDQAVTGTSWAALG